MEFSNKMNIFLDTNIVLDFLIQREPFFLEADKIIQIGLKSKNSLFIAAHSILNIDYIIRKFYSCAERKFIIKYAI